MARLINKTQNGFTVVAQNITKDERLGMKERGLLVTLLSLPDNWEYSVLGLTRILPDGRDAIQASVRKLEEFGYIKRVQAKDEKGKFSGYDWEVTDVPFTGNPSTENPSTENPSAENPSAEKPSTENPPQLNNNKLITNESNTNLSINQKSSAAVAAEPLLDGLMDENVLLQLKEQIDFEILVSDPLFSWIERNDLDLVVELLAELSTSTTPQTFNGISYSPERIIKSISKIDSETVQYVLSCFYETRPDVKNLRQYLKTALFNAPSTIDTYYSSKARKDLGEASEPSELQKTFEILTQNICSEHCE